MSSPVSEKLYGEFTADEKKSVACLAEEGWNSEFGCLFYLDLQKRLSAQKGLDAEVVRFSAKRISGLPCSITYLPKTGDLLVRDCVEFTSGLVKTLRKCIHVYDTGEIVDEVDLRVKEDMRGTNEVSTHAEFDLIERLASHPNLISKPILRLKRPSGKESYIYPFCSQVLDEALPEMSNGEFLGHFLKVLDALDHLHANGVVHGDVHTGQVLLDNGTPILTDLGEAITDAKELQENPDFLRSFLEEKFSIPFDIGDEYDAATTTDDFRLIVEKLQKLPLEPAFGL